MAIAMVLLMLLLVGVADFGRAFHDYIIIANASREGARYGSRFPHDHQGILDRTIQEAAASDLDPPLQKDTDIEVIGLSGPTGGSIQVKVTYQFDTLMASLVRSITGSQDLRLQAGTSMIIFGLD